MSATDAMESAFSSSMSAPESTGKIKKPNESPQPVAEIVSPQPKSFLMNGTFVNGRNVTLRARREAQGPQGLEGTALEYRFK